MPKPTKKEMEKWEAEEMPKHMDAIIAKTGLEHALGLASLHVKRNGSPVGKELDPLTSALFKYIRTNV